MAVARLARGRDLWISVLVALCATVLAAVVLASPARADPVYDSCELTSPSAAICIGAQKLAEAAAAECRRLGRPASDCKVPLAHEVGADVSDSYRRSWLHRAAAFQYRLADRLPLLRAPWLGTHNSFNSVNDAPTPSHTDSNQQLSLGQQLDVDMRSLELDVHWLPSLRSNGSNAVVVCHGRGPDEQDFGCTNERLLSDVLPEIAGWLNAPEHRRQVVLLYVEDELGDANGYAATVTQLDRALRRPDGSSLIYRPSGAEMTSKGCANLPLGISRGDIRDAGAQVVLVGNCRPGWAADVYSWDDVHVESGSTPGYRPFPTCDATYPRSTYDAKLVRYYEDSTFVSAAVDPTSTPQAAEAQRLTPARVAAMTGCGVGLFGFDQLLPNDGRIAATIWSWAQDKPNAADGRCAVQRADGRWVTRPCEAPHRAACRTATGWQLTKAAVAYAAAGPACRAEGGQLALPRTGYGNSLLHATTAGREVWLDYRLPPPAS